MFFFYIPHAPCESVKKRCADNEKHKGNKKTDEKKASRDILWGRNPIGVVCCVCECVVLSPFCYEDDLSAVRQDEGLKRFKVSHER
jgi:hypothetical protein